MSLSGNTRTVRSIIASGANTLEPMIRKFLPSVPNEIVQPPHGILIASFWDSEIVFFRSRGRFGCKIWPIIVSAYMLS